MSSPHRQSLKTYGRRGGRPLSARQQSLIDTTLPLLSVPVETGAKFHPKALFGPKSAYWLEIGFGGGEHVSGQAERHPEVGLLASEVFIEGVAKLLGQIEDAALTNIRIWDEDARDLMAALETDSLDRAFILFPDPWPKARHQKRRLIQASFLTELARILKPGGQVRFATDVRSYADSALVQFLQHPAFHWLARTSADWTQPPQDHVTTRYQEKRLGDVAPVYFEFEVASS